MKTRTLPYLAALVLALTLPQAHARPFRPAMFPNGTVNGCANCHLNPAGGGPRTPFGNDVYAIVKGSGPTPFWTPTLAKKDSDGDGFTNGQEVGDPEGTGTAFPGAKVSNPGVASSMPALTPPQVTITSPGAGTAVAAPYDVSIQVEAKADVGDIVKVEMMDGANLLGLLTAPPFNWSLTLTNPGTYTLTAKATDYLGASAVSDPVTIVLNAASNAPPISIVGIDRLQDAVTITWTGGAGPYLLQKKSGLGDTNWFNVLTTTELYVTVANDGDTGFYRVMDKAASTVIPFTAMLEGGAEIPPVTTGARGLGSLSLESMQLAYSIHFSGLSAEAFAAHIHGPADAGHAAGVLLPLSGAAGTAGVLSGSVTLTADQVAALMSGMTYINIHTTNSPGGEIRGQVVPLRIPVTLNGAGESPAVNTSATGSGWITLVGNHMYYDIDFDGLTSNAFAAHIHGPADAGQSAGVEFPLEGASGLSGTLEGGQILTTEQLTNLLAGLSYVNIHTDNNKGGEIRGQVVPQH